MGVIDDYSIFLINDYVGTVVCIDASLILLVFVRCVGMLKT